MGAPVASIGFYCEAGPKFDPKATPGLSHMMRYGLFGSNMNQSVFQTDRQLRAYGAGYNHLEVRKRFVGLKAEVKRDAVEPVVSALATNIVCPRFAETDMERFRDTMDAELEEMKFKDTHRYAATMLEHVAFYKENLGMPRYVAPWHNDLCTTTACIEHWASTFKPNRIVLAGVNVDHDALTAAYMATGFPHSAEAPHHARSTEVSIDQKAEKSQYLAGREQSDVENWGAMTSHPESKQDAVVAIGWLTAGRDGNVKDFAAASVVREVLGMTQQNGEGDQLNGDRVQNYFDGVRTFYNAYSTAGLMGITVKATKDKILAETIANAKLPKSVDAAKIEGAKARANMRLYNEELENQRDYADFIATSGFSYADFQAAVKNLTAADINASFEALKAQKPVMYSAGHVEDIPRLQDIQAAQ